MKKPIQLNLFKSDLRFFGGALLKGKRKSLRPLSTKDPIHLVMRSTWAKGHYSFLRAHNKKTIENILGAMGKKFNIKTYQVAIQSNHIHIILRISHRSHYKAFIKALSSKIALHVMKAKSFKEFQERLQPQQQLQDRGYGSTQQTKAFWEHRPFTRVLHWGKDFKNCCQYLTQNTLEAIGFINYSPRTNYYAKYLQTTKGPAG